MLRGRIRLGSAGRRGALGDRALPCFAGALDLVRQVDAARSEIAPTMLRGRIRLGSAGSRGALGDRAPLHPAPFRETSRHARLKRHPDPFALAPSFGNVKPGNAGLRTRRVENASAECSANFRLHRIFALDRWNRVVQSDWRRTRVFFYRDQKGLEVDLLVVGKHGILIPFEFKLSQTPKAEMGGGIERFQKIHQSTDPSTGHLISLSEKTGSLTRSVQLTPVTSMPEVLRKTLS